MDKPLTNERREHDRVVDAAMFHMHLGAGGLLTLTPDASTKFKGVTDLADIPRGHEVTLAVFGMNELIWKAFIAGLDLAYSDDQAADMIYSVGDVKKEGLGRIMLIDKVGNANVPTTFTVLRYDSSYPMKYVRQLNGAEDAYPHHGTLAYRI